MGHGSLKRAFLFLWIGTGVVILWMSVGTALPELVTADRPANSHLLLLACIEAIAAILFLVPPTLQYGGTSLLVVFGVALGMHALQGEFAAPLVLYSAAVLFVTLHGRPAMWNRE